MRLLVLGVLAGIGLSLHSARAFGESGPPKVELLLRSAAQGSRSISARTQALIYKAIARAFSGDRRFRGISLSAAEFKTNKPGLMVTASVESAGVQRREIRCSLSLRVTRVVRSDGEVRLQGLATAQGKNQREAQLQYIEEQE